MNRKTIRAVATTIALIANFALATTLVATETEAQDLAALIVGSWTVDASQSAIPGHSDVAGTLLINTDNTYRSLLSSLGVTYDDSGTWSLSGNIYTEFYYRIKHGSRRRHLELHTNIIQQQ